MSLILRPKISLCSVSAITLAAGLAVCRALKALGVDAGIKWPNDVYINGKKVCGILTEMGASSEGIDYVVVGIGINVNTRFFPQELENIACSLYTVTNKIYERNVIIAEVWKQFENIYAPFLSEGFSAIKNEYTRNCINIGRKVNVLCAESYEATAVDVNDSGELVVITENGEEKTVFSGEVSIRNI